MRLLEAVRSGDWSEFHRVLGQSPADIGTEGTGAGGAVVRVGDEAVDSPFATRLRCLCHRMLLPVRMHALRALNKSYMKREKVPLVSGKGPSDVFCCCRGSNVNCILIEVRARKCNFGFGNEMGGVVLTPCMAVVV